MKFTLAVLALATAANALSEEAQTLLVSNAFEEFKTEHGKVYEADEHAKRLSIFSENLEKIAAKNAALRELGHDEVHGVNRFADLTEEEFQFFLGVDANIEPAKLESFNGPKLNATSGAYNLYDDNLVTPVKDQMQCGSCWAFSATETIESAWIKAGNPMKVFSPQQIVSCDKTDAGCNGGLPTQAFDYVKSAGGMATDDAYPYTSGTGNSGTCKSDFSTVGGTVSSWAYTQPAAGRFSSGNTEDSDAMASVLQQYGGISIAIDASQWNSYTGGVMTSASCSSKPSKMDHAVQVVGYDMDASDGPYWIVRNSWNTGWGEKGFIRLKAGENTCGIANLAAYVSAV